MTLGTGLLMAFTLSGALLAITLRNVLHAIFGLALALIGLAGLFVILNSPFVAIMEVLIYVGGITVAMVFAVMLSTVASTRAVETPRRQALAATVAFTVFAAIAPLLIGTDFGAQAEQSEQAWTVQTLGVNLLDRYNLVFETLSVILLLAIIGAIVIARKPSADPTEGGDPPPVVEGGGA
ncbi:MAG: NADH-quinone oxidoreductase subunit J [Myxococcota bacterium]|nr:NADH-quinone oxidoreductase subunit J [Myxococcota bacterium]